MKDFMLRCPDGHFVAPLKSAPYWFADAFCKACDDWVPMDYEDQMQAIRRFIASQEKLA
jgi:hypothetical protein